MAKGSLLNRPKKVIKRAKPKPPAQPTPSAPHSDTVQESAGQDLGQANSSASDGGTGAPSPNPSAVGQFSPDSLYNSVISALNFKREADALVSGQAPAPTVPTQKLADTPSIASALGNLQHNLEARRAVGETTSLRDYLEANQKNIEGLKIAAVLPKKALTKSIWSTIYLAQSNLR